MPDREKVIKGLEHCMAADETCKGCPYEGTTCTTTLNADALALLKEQESLRADNAVAAEIPETYDPREDYVACTNCLICDRPIPLRRYEHGPLVCSECKNAVLNVYLNSLNI